MGKSFICGEVIYVWGSHSLIQGGKKLCPKICGELGMGKTTSGEDRATHPVKREELGGRKTLDWTQPADDN